MWRFDEQALRHATECCGLRPLHDDVMTWKRFPHYWPYRATNMGPSSTR